MKINNKGYLLVEIVIAAVIAFAIAYFLFDLTVNLGNKEEDYYINTLLETDKLIMTKDIMNDISSYNLVSVTSDNNSYVDLLLKDANDANGVEVLKKLKVYKDSETDELIYEYGTYTDGGYNSPDYIKKVFSSELNVQGIEIVNTCLYDNEYRVCDGLSDEEKNSVVDGLVNIKVDAKTLYSDYNYGIELNIQYKYKQVSIVVADLTINTNNISAFNSSNGYSNNNSCIKSSSVKWDFTNNKFIVSSLNSSETCDVNFNSTTNKLVNVVESKASSGVRGSSEYRYIGRNPDNYVIFNNELWRIIGTFSSNTHGKSQKLTKIIKAESIGSFVWNKNSSNNWKDSTLYTLLNNYYYNGTDATNTNYCWFSANVKGNCDFRINGLNATSRSMIETVNWKVGGSSDNGVTAATSYNNERSGSGYVTAPVGLMYLSDYGYATDSGCDVGKELWFYTEHTSPLKCTYNWLINYVEWTLNKITSTSNIVAYVNDEGDISPSNGNGDRDIVSTSKNVRPVVYLKNNVIVLSGDGSDSNPYILGMN